jgi:hypothetical protein
MDILLNCLESIEVECQPTTQAAGIRISAETFLSRDASLKDEENLGQVPPKYFLSKRFYTLFIVSVFLCIQFQYKFLVFSQYHEKYKFREISF